MSYSTQVTVTVGNTTIMYTYASRVIAQAHNIPLGQIGMPVEYAGREAYELIQRAPHTVLPDEHMMLVKHQLNEYLDLYEQDIAWDTIGLYITVELFN